jgi:hypothetical protein
MTKPRIMIYKDFLPTDEWEALKSCALANDSQFKPFPTNHGLRWRDYEHTRLKGVKYRKNYILSDEEVRKIESGEIEQIGYPPTEALGFWVFWPDDEYINEIVSKCMDMTVDAVKDVWNEEVIYEFGNAITKINTGGSMHLHCDGVFMETPGAFTHYASVYYLNDDYEGGENIFPALGLQYKPMPNSLILFNNVWDEEMIHGINPVISGSRYMMQAFFTPKPQHADTGN